MSVVPQPLRPRLGHVHLRVADLDRATAFYRDLLGLRVTADGRAIGVPAVFLACDDYHHDLGLNTFESDGGAPPDARHTGLQHVAFVYPDCAALARVVRGVHTAGHAIDAAQDHGGTVSVYLRDPEGNGVELYYDRPRETWFDEHGNPILKAEPIELDSLLG